MSERQHDIHTLHQSGIVSMQCVHPTCVQVAATLDAPFADRHNEGSLRFNVEFSPMASPAFEPGGRPLRTLTLRWLAMSGVCCHGWLCQGCPALSVEAQLDSSALLYAMN